MECKDTADVLLFFDELFDSMNGSHDNSKKRSGKLLLRAVTPNSEHSKVWARAKKILKSIKFISIKGKEGSVPSVTNWLRTLEGIELLKEKLFTEHKVKSFWMRHLNQDPLENFFGCIRSHGSRNVSPTPSGFESAFASLLINNLSSNHSVGSNCEEDDCKIFQSMDCLLKKDLNDSISTEINYIDFDDINCEIIDFNDKRRNPRIISQLSYVTGYVLKKAKQKVFKNCKKCKELLFNNNDATELNEYIRIREFSSSLKSLTYPSENTIKLFSAIQDVLTSILKKKSELPSLKSYMTTILYTVIDFNFLTCPDHRKELIEFIFEFGSRFFINNWCREVNFLLNGTRTEKADTDIIKELASDYYQKRHNKKM